MRVFCLYAICVLAGGARPAWGTPMVYWTSWTTFSEGRVYRSDLNGANQQLLFTNSPGRYTTGLQVDPVSGVAYFGEFYGTGGGARIWKMNLDGSQASVLATTSNDAVFRLSLDQANQVLYFTTLDNPASPRLARVNTDGSGLSYFGPNGTYFEAMDLDPVRGDVFFQNNSDKAVSRISTSGGAADLVFNDGTGFFTMETDPANERLFLPYGNTIGQRSYSGTFLTFTDAVAPTSIASLQHLPGEGKLYFSSIGGDFGYVDLFNSNAVTPLFDSNMFMYASDVVVPEPSALAMLLIPLTALRRRRSPRAIGG